MKSGIYLIRHESGRVYVGSSVDIDKRWKDHTRDLERGRHINKHLQHAWSKYGPGEFEFAILEMCPIEYLLQVEQIWIDRLRACDRNYGYNIALYADAPTRGRKLEPSAARDKAASARRGESRAEVVRQKIRATLTGRKRDPEIAAKGVATLAERRTMEQFAIDVMLPALELPKRVAKPEKVYKRSAEVRARMGAASKGRKYSAESRLKMSESAKIRAARTGLAEKNRNRLWTDEARQKIADKVKSLDATRAKDEHNRYLSVDLDKLPVIGPVQ